MGKDDIENAETREVINETLKDILCDEGWGKSIWDGLVKSLREEFGIETDIMELAQNAPCLVEVFQIGALGKKGIIKKETQKRVSEIIHQLVRLAHRASTGDASALNQLKVAHKIVYPNVYQFPVTVIENLAERYHTPPHLARAWAVRSIMVEIDLVLEPTREGASLLDGAVKLTTAPNLVKSDLYKSVASYMRRNSTLQSIAIDMYIDELSREGITLDEERLKDDLRKLKEWEDAHFTQDDELRTYYKLWCGDKRYPRAYLPVIPMYSEDWKRRLLRRRGGKEK